MNELNQRERYMLDRIRAIYPTDLHCPRTLMQRAMADDLRRNFPELDDITLARVVLAVAGRLAFHASADGLDGVSLASLAGGAAVDLAALELEEPPHA